MELSSAAHPVRGSADALQREQTACVRLPGCSHSAVRPNLRTHSSCPRSHRRLYTLRCGMLWPKAKLSTHRLAHCADGPNAGRAAPGAKACECFLAVRHWAGHACSDDLYFSDLSAKEFRTDTNAGTSTCSYTSTWMNIMKSSFGILNTEAMSLKRTGSAKVKAGRSS